MDETSDRTSPDGKPGQSDGEPQTKRARVSLACQRCKSRKQKCDGGQPSCSSCTRFNVSCQYMSLLIDTHYPLGWKPGGKKFYITALENRVAELEAQLSSLGNEVVNEDHWKGVQLHQAQKARDNEIDTLSSAIRDLSFSANGHYVGGTSTVALGKLLGSVINRQDPSGAQSVPKEPGQNLDDIEDMTTESPSTTSPSSETLAKTMGPMFVSDSVSQRLFEAYLKHISTRFPVLHTASIKKLHETRHNIDNSYDEAMIHLVYAISGRFLELTGEPGSDQFYSDQHYDAAVAHLDDILKFGDTRSVVYLVLLGVYSIRAAKDVGAWMYVGLAMRLCVEIGLHRRSKQKPSLKTEMDKRIFWSCYTLDREVAVAMGRPLALPDSDIDLELPFDIDEATDDDETILKASRSVLKKPRSPPTSLTSFIHHVRLKRIESEIQNQIYRVDKPFSRHLIQVFYTRLTAWEKALPPECRGPQQYSETKPFDSIDVYHIVYHRACRLLLYPTLSETPINLQYVALCAQACGNVCESYKRLHHSVNIAFAPLSLQNIFLAGLTLVYCLWLAPSLLENPANTIALTDCSIMMYVMAERYPSAIKYRDVFEQIKSSVLQILSTSKQQPNLKGPKRLASFDTDMREKVRRLESGFGSGGAREEFSRMMGELTNGRAVEEAKTSPGVIAGKFGPDPVQLMIQQPKGDLVPYQNPVDDINLTIDQDFNQAVYEYENLGDDWSGPILNEELMAGMAASDFAIDSGDWGTLDRV